MQEEQEHELVAMAPPARVLYGVIAELREEIADLREGAEMAVDHMEEMEVFIDRVATELDMDDRNAITLDDIVAKIASWKRHRLLRRRYHLRPIEDNMKCSVCLENAKSHIFTGCGHFCVCGGCVTKIPGGKCPICREVSAVVKVF